MNKSLLTASVLGAFSAAVSSVAFADIVVNGSSFCKPGFYVGVQGGLSDTYYKSDTLNAEQNKELGTANLNYQQSNSNSTKENWNFNGLTTQTMTAHHIDDGGLGGRVYAGYQFDPYFALELGYTQYADAEVSSSGTRSTTYTLTRTPPLNSPWGGTAKVPATYHTSITEHAIDLSAKATLPLEYGFGTYLKAGMAYIAAEQNTSTTLGYLQGQGPLTYGSINPIPNNVTNSHTENHHALRPVAGAGINYTIPNTSMSVGADYSRVFSSGNIKNAGLLSLGLEYKFA